MDFSLQKFTALLSYTEEQLTHPNRSDSSKGGQQGNRTSSRTVGSISWEMKRENPPGQLKACQGRKKSRTH